MDGSGSKIAAGRLNSTIARRTNLSWANISGKPTTFAASVHAASHTSAGAIRSRRRRSAHQQWAHAHQGEYHRLADHHGHAYSGNNSAGRWRGQARRWVALNEYSAPECRQHLLGGTGGSGDSYSGHEDGGDDLQHACLGDDGGGLRARSLLQPRSGQWHQPQRGRAASSIVGGHRCQPARAHPVLLLRRGRGTRAHEAGVVGHGADG
jgi:hypothetical protein